MRTLECGSPPYIVTTREQNGRIGFCAYFITDMIGKEYCARTKQSSLLNTMFYNMQGD